MPWMSFYKQNSGECRTLIDRLRAGAHATLEWLATQYQVATRNDGHVAVVVPLGDSYLLAEWTFKGVVYGVAHENYVSVLIRKAEAAVYVDTKVCPGVVLKLHALKTFSYGLIGMGWKRIASVPFSQPLSCVTLVQYLLNQPLVGISPDEYVRSLSE